MSDKIIEILNNDPAARKFKEEYEKQMELQNLTDEEKAKHTDFMMMLCIKNNKEAMDLMATEFYNEVNGR